MKRRTTSCNARRLAHIGRRAVKIHVWHIRCFTNPIRLRSPPLRDRGPLLVSYRFVEGITFMLRASYRFALIASLSLATLSIVVSDASAGPRHRRAKNNSACGCSAPVVTTSGCSMGSMGSTGCSTGCGGYSSSPSGSYYPYSGQTSVSNGNYSTSGSSMNYPNAGYQGGNYYSSPVNGNGYGGNAYGTNNYNGNLNSNVTTGASAGAAIGQAVGGNSGATVGAAIGAAAGAR